ncbi:MAG: WXG100 family type VII secretion target [Lachnospiraceae bacterium]|nr:WXG100 family type VII secretion target [Lachnospiraceae bacterium]
MAAKNTVNYQKMRAAISELENIHTNMMKHMKSLDETMASVKKVWKGEAANEYLKQYQKNLKDFQNMAESIHSASNALAESCNVYEMTDAQAMEIVSKMGKRG